MEEFLELERVRQLKYRYFARWTGTTGRRWPTAWPPS